MGCILANLKAVRWGFLDHSDGGDKLRNSGKDFGNLNEGHEFVNGKEGIECASKAFEGGGGEGGKCSSGRKSWRFQFDAKFLSTNETPPLLNIFMPFKRLGFQEH